MLGDLLLHGNTKRVTEKVKQAKELFGANRPYETELRLDGQIIIFNEHFITTLREALSSGCVAKMGHQEELILQKFIEYANGNTYRDITQDTSGVMVALDKWLGKLRRCVKTPAVGECYDAPTHTWKGCEVNNNG